MMPRQRMTQNWERVRDQIKKMWADYEFDDKELSKARGDLKAMLRIIEEKTGESKAEILQKIQAIL